ncbi:hypothetical protein CC2G_003416 [Coprinopsis cinerea AmutBmut pab1-1]|nr:hypothetical protein CC2G_003416 [Coprinopsis cinerea AmutBmut pab1-1]
MLIGFPCFFLSTCRRSCCMLQILEGLAIKSPLRCACYGNRSSGESPLEETAIQLILRERPSSISFDPSRSFYATGRFP